MLFRELRLLVSSPLLWLTLATSIVLSLVFSPSSSSFALRAVLCVALPVVAVAASSAADSATTRALLQLGHRPLGLALARLFALLVVAVVLLAAPVLHAPLSLADPGALATTAVGAGCVAVAHVGISLFAASAVSSRGSAGAMLAALTVTCGAWAAEAARAPFAFAMPTSALRVFERGLLDGKDVVTLVAGGVGLTIAAALLSSHTAPIEARIARCAAVLVVTAVLCGASSQLRLSTDLTRGRRASFPAPWVSALAQVGDRVEVTVHVRRDDPRVDVLEQRVLLPLRRYAKVRVRFRPSTSTPTSTAVATWGVGSRTKDSDATEPDVIVPIILDLAGVR